MAAAGLAHGPIRDGKGAAAAEDHSGEDGGAIEPQNSGRMLDHKSPPEGGHHLRCEQKAVVGPRVLWPESAAV